MDSHDSLEFLLLRSSARIGMLVEHSSNLRHVYDDLVWRRSSEPCRRMSQENESCWLMTQLFVATPSVPSSSFFAMQERQKFTFELHRRHYCILVTWASTFQRSKNSSVIVLSRMISLNMSALIAWRISRSMDLFVLFEETSKQMIRVSLVIARRAWLESILLNWNFKWLFFNFARITRKVIRSTYPSIIIIFSIWTLKSLCFSEINQ